MASEYQMALIRATAVERLETAAKKLAKRFEGVQGLDGPLSRINGRGDPDLAHAKQLEALAGVMDEIVEAVETADKGSQSQTEELQKQLETAQARIEELTAELEAATAPQTPAPVTEPVTETVTAPGPDTSQGQPNDQGKTKGGK